MSGELNIFAPISFGTPNQFGRASQMLSFPTGPNPLVASVQMLSQGAVTGAFTSDDLQCTAASLGTCSADLSFGSTIPGAWTGALQLFDASTPANLLVSIPVYGTANGAQIAFSDGAQSTISTGFSVAEALAFDGSGNGYVIDNGGVHVVYKMTPGGSLIPIGSGWNSPRSVVVDGAGDVYVTDSELNGVFEITPAGVQTEVLSGLSDPTAMAIDEAGNLYISEVGYNVYKWTPGASTQTLIYAGTAASGWPVVSALAFDPSGNLYFSDAIHSNIYRISSGAAGLYSSTVPFPKSIAFDPAGNMYAASAPDAGPQAVYIITPAGTVSTTWVLASTLPYNDIVLDPLGNLYQVNSVEILKLDRADPPALNFATTAAGQTSTDSPQTVTVQNIGNEPLNFSAVSFPADFPESSGASGDCISSTSLSEGTACTLTIDFSPVTAGGAGTIPLNESVTVTTNALNATAAQQTISVSGTEVIPAAPLVSFSAISVAFGNQTVGTESAAQVVTLTNTGQAPLTISSIALTGANTSQFIYGTTTSCTTVAINGTCTFRVRFNPTVAGAASAAITITDNAAGSPHAIALSGTGVQVPVVSLSASAEAFGNQTVGMQSAAQVVTLTNTGQAPLSISGIALTGANTSQFVYGTTTACTTIAVNGTCTFRVRFNPTVTGADSAAITITDNAADSPQSIALTGTGVQLPAVSLSASTVAFGNQTLNTESAAQVVTLTNTGQSALTISSIALTGTSTSQFIYGTTTACTTIAVNGTCTFRVRFNPTVTGADSAAITITDNAAGSPHAIALSGTGVGVPAVSLSATTVPFGSEAINTESAAQVVTLTNTGTSPLSISSIALTGANTSQFVYGTTTACTTIPVNGTCTFRVRFNPTVAGAASAAITITDNAAGSPHAIALSGTGVGVPAVSLTATTVAFGTQAVKTESAAQVVTLTNTGTGPLSISSIALTGANTSQFIYGTTTACTTIAAEGTCTFRVRFNPTVTGAASAAITITDNAAGSPHAIALSGTGQ